MCELLAASAPVPPAPAVVARVEVNRLGIHPDDLFGVARRRNPKRSALFVSRVLAKHIPVEGSRAILAGLVLGHEVGLALGAEELDLPEGLIARGLADAASASAVVERLIGAPSDPGEVIVLGFAETATGLGHIVADALDGSRLVLTTRIEPTSVPVLARFEEEHSHATAQLVAHRDARVLESPAPLVLVDDELTTGRTALNTIAALHRRWPRDRYLVASLLDWRDAEAHAAFAATSVELGVRIDAVSLMSGRVEGDLVDDTPLADIEWVPSSDHVVAEKVRVEVDRVSGRHGWDPPDGAALDAVLPSLARSLRRRVTGERVLFVGTEELMYLPIRLAAAFGPEALVQSTTRSPIIAADVAGYPVRHRRSVCQPGQPGRPSYVYNLASNSYDDIVVVVEGPLAADEASRVASSFADAATRIHLLELVSRGAA